MAFLIILRENWFNLLQSLGIVAGLVFTGLTLRIDAKVRRVANSFEITRQHREIWSQLYERPELRRILNASVDPSKQPVTADEELFIHFLFLHLSAAYRAMSNGMLILPQELGRDVKSFLSLPIPRAVWQSTRHLRNRDFVSFVERYFETSAERL